MSQKTPWPFPAYQNHDAEPEFDESSVQSHAGLDDLEVPLTPEMAAEVEKAHANALAGKPGELRFQIQVKRADGSVEDRTLVGRVTGVS